MGPSSGCVVCEGKEQMLLVAGTREKEWDLSPREQGRGKIWKLHRVG